MKYSSGRTPFIVIIVYEERNYFCSDADGRTEFFPAEISPGPDVSKCPYDLCFTQYLLGSARSPGPSTATFSFPGGGTFIKTPVNSAVRRSRETPTTGRGLRFIQCYSTA